MARSTMHRRLLAAFLGELEERLLALDSDLLALEREVDPNARIKLLDTLFRTAHSLKGAAGSVGSTPIEAVCHGLEDLFDAARGDRIPVDPDLLQRCFSAADQVREAGWALRQQYGESNGRRPDAPSDAVKSPATGVAANPGPLSSAVPARSDRSSRDAVVRIPAEKLDALLVKSGELAVARRRVQARSVDAAELLDFAQRWRAEWSALEKTLVRALAHSGPSRRLTQAVARNGDHLKHLDREFRRLASNIAEDHRLLEQAGMPLEVEVRRVRMLPFAEACEGLDRMSRDLARKSGKTVDLVVEGGGIEFDRSILEGVKDPLLHLLRNAVDHGIELPAVRRAVGKPAVGRITVAAALRGGVIEVTVADDGAGLDIEAIREQAHRRGLPPMPVRELIRSVFLPGFSTAPAVTAVSGRGVGLDAVLTRLRALRATIDVTSEAGTGTRFILTLPLTLTTIRVLLVTAGGQSFALDVDTVTRLLLVDPAELRSVAGRDVLMLDGATIPIIPLTGLLGLTPVRQGGERHRLPVLVLGMADEQAAIVVDELSSEQEIMVRSLGPRLGRVRYITGSTILQSGRIALILDARALIGGVLGATAEQRFAVAPAGGAAITRKRLLLAEDSLTTRTLMRNILEDAGYAVTVVADGAQAWERLQETGADLVVSDIDMPNMGGFELTAVIRGSERFRNLPVVLITARESEADKERGMTVGADAYLVKSVFDQANLLETITQFL